MSEGIAEFFKKYGGRRLDVADSKPIESGMTIDHLREELARYQQMLVAGARPNGERLTADEGAEIAMQANRFRAELARRQTNG